MSAHVMLWYTSTIAGMGCNALIHHYTICLSIFIVWMPEKLLVGKVEPNTLQLCYDKAKIIRFFVSNHPESKQLGSKGLWLS